MSARFYTVADERYFLGAVGLVNSLRLVGHGEPIHLLDIGLTGEQRALLEPEVTLVEGPPSTPPWLQMSVAPLAHPDDVMVLIDADMVVTRSLGEVIDQARAGEVIAVEHGSDRHRPEWGEVLSLGEVRRQPYVCSGLLVTGREPGVEVLELMEELAGRVEIERTWFGRREDDYPLLFPDQDILNAILASRVDADRVVALDRELEPIPPFEGVEVVDEKTLCCRLPDGREPYLLHHYAAKPWLEETPEGPYSLLLRRLLGGDDLAIEAPARMIPKRLRSGAFARALRARASGAGRFDAYFREPLAGLVRGRRRG